MSEQVKNTTDGITNLDDCKAWVREKYPMRGHKTGEMIRSLITEVELLRLATSQLEAKVYHTAPGQLEFAPEGWTWQQQCRAEHDRYIELEAECEAQSQRLTAATKRAEVWEAEARAWREYGLAESEDRVNDAIRAWGKAQGAMMRTDAITTSPLPGTIEAVAIGDFHTAAIRYTSADGRQQLWLCPEHEGHPSHWSGGLIGFQTHAARDAVFAAGNFPPIPPPFDPHRPNQPPAAQGASS